VEDEDGNTVDPHEEQVMGECSRCGSWPVRADESNDNLSACCGSYLIVD
jgi:hypothetical protein